MSNLVTQENPIIFGQLAKYIVDNEQERNLNKIETKNLENVDRLENEAKEQIIANIFDISADLLHVETLDKNFMEFIWKIKVSNIIIANLNRYSDMDNVKNFKAWFIVNLMEVKTKCSDDDLNKPILFQIVNYFQHDVTLSKDIVPAIPRTKTIWRASGNSGCPSPPCLPCRWPQ